MPNNVEVVWAKVPERFYVHIFYVVLGLQPRGFEMPIGFGQVCPSGAG